MTLAKAAMNSISRINCPERKIISNIFFNKWKNNSVVLDSWFSFNASIEIDEKTISIEKLFENKFFDSKSPNTLRAIFNTFVTRNSTFHAMVGSGYKYIAKKIIEFDKLNPIVISRFVKVFSRYNYYSEPYKNNMVETIKQIKKHKLSTNTKEVLDAMVNLAKGGMTMIVVTHEMGFAKEVADEVVFMDEGMIVERAKTKDFFANPKNERTKLFLSQIL